MQRTKLIVAVVLLGASVVVWIATNRDDDAMNDPAFTTFWKCNACTHLFELLPQERAEALRLNGAPPIICLKCSQRAAYQVAGCPVCETLYFSSEVPGATGVCPICNPPKQRHDLPDEDTTEAARPAVPRN